MVESISQFRQMMAEQKFFEVMRLLEVQFSLQDKSHRHELLLIYVEALKAQDKSIPASIILEVAEFEFQNKNFEKVSELLSGLQKNEEQKFFIRVQKLKIETAEQKGLMNDLYLYVAQFLLHQFQFQNPVVPSWLESIVQKYFKHDFSLKLHILGLTLLTHDLKSALTLTKELIFSCVEKSSPKGIKDKLSSIGEVLRSTSNKGELDIYQNFIDVSVSGISKKSDYKKIVEMVIAFDDFKMQTLLLNFLHDLNMKTFANDYAHVVRENPEYDFVYFDKYFSHLKPYFFKKQETPVRIEKFQAPNLDLEDDYSSDMFSSSIEFVENDEEQKFFHLIKHQSFSVDQLCDLAVSFLQSEMPKVALRASDKAMKEATSDKDFLKASYLKLTSLLQLKDYRAALDVCLVALTKAESKDDILSFMYGEAELYIRLEETKQAKIILSKIIAIDSQYRLAKERLEKLNEI